MRLLCSVPVAIVFLCSDAEARDEFSAVRCNQNVPAALLGRKSGSDAVVQIEGRHRDLNLKNLGGEDISDSLNSAAWQICGTEYQVLYDSRQVVRDVLSFPAHGRNSPAFSGTCRRNGQVLPGTVVAVLDNGRADVRGAARYSTTDETLLPAKAAWRIDVHTIRFVAVATTGLRCPRNGIITADGGP